MNNPAITITLWQFENALEEWHNPAVLWRYRCEILSEYSAGYSIRDVANLIAAKIKDKR